MRISIQPKEHTVILREAPGLSKKRISLRLSRKTSTRKRRGQVEKRHHCPKERILRGAVMRMAWRGWESPCGNWQISLEKMGRELRGGGQGVEWNEGWDGRIPIDVEWGGLPRDWHAPPPC